MANRCFSVFYRTLSRRYTEKERSYPRRTHYGLFNYWISAYRDPPRIKVRNRSVFSQRNRCRWVETGCLSAENGAVDTPEGRRCRLYPVQWFFPLWRDAGHRLYAERHSKAVCRSEAFRYRHILCHGPWVSGGAGRCQSIYHEKVVQYELPLHGTRAGWWYGVEAPLRCFSGWLSSGAFSGHSDKARGRRTVYLFEAGPLYRQ